MFVSDAMMIPSSLGTSMKQSSNGTIPRVAGSPWVGPSWPLAGTSIGRQTPHFGMGTSPFGKSVDMVDVCKQLMEGAHVLTIFPCTLSYTVETQPSSSGHSLLTGTLL